MAWNPPALISGGMYGGYQLYEGSLTAFATSYLENVAIQSNTVLGNGNFENKSWDGAYGLSDVEMFNYALGHKDGQSHEIDLYEIDIENPEGAQYYKQSILFRGYIQCSNELTNTVTISGETYSARYVQIYFKVGEIYRKEYPTPYTTPTVTRLSAVANRQVYFTYLLEGDEIAIAAGYKNSVYKHCYVPVGEGTFSNTPFYGHGLYVKTKNLATGVETQTSGALLGVAISVLKEAFGGDFKPKKKKDPNQEEPPEKGPGKGGGGGGNGDHTLPDDPIPVPPLPNLGPASVSWLTVYMMSKTDIDEFGTELVDPTAMQMLKQYFTDPLDAIVGIIMVPAVPAGPRYPKTPVIHGNPDYSWSRSFMACSSQYADINCGIINVEPYWDSAFDFDSYTRFSLFLPFIGFKELKADDIVGSNVSVEYHVDVCTGDCTAFVSRTAPSDMIYGPMPSQVIATYNGNCGIRVPIGRISHDAAIDASMRLLSAGVGAVGGAALAGMGLVDPNNISMSQASNQISGACMSAINAQKRTVERSGAMGGCAGYMGILKPYLIRHIPRQFLPDNYKELNGYPANVGGTLSHYTGTGYQAVETIRLEGINAYDSELDEINKMLKGGVLV